MDSYAPIPSSQAHDRKPWLWASLFRVLLPLFLGLFLVMQVAWSVLSHHEVPKHFLSKKEDDREFSYNTNAGPVEGKLNVHLVAHTHDDVGWLKTVDQYYVGSNNSIQVAAVQYILDSVVSALQEDSNRKFIYVETAFFQRWWRQQSKSKKNVVRKLVKSGQLEFINGGWCMHDEASTHYIDMIDQTTLGHRFIKEQFDIAPRIGWQIDPFGHSAVQAYLLGAEVGFDAVFFARADYQDIAKRRKDVAMEFIWRGSKSLGVSSQLFGGVLDHHYDAPEGFKFEIKSDGPPIQDDPLLYDYNVENRVNAFVEYATKQSKQFQTNHIMWTMGEDFAYEYANTWFKQMDKLVHYVNKDGRVNVFYSTPSLYVDAKHAANLSWPLKIDDFFPYADAPHVYWTGYFSSRTALKGYVRRMSAYLLAARQLEFVVGRQAHGHNTDSLEEAVAILQHHDGVSGTEKQHVANDYAYRLAYGQVEASKVINAAFSKLLSGILDSPFNKKIGTSGQAKGDLSFDQCLLLNVSYCPLSESKLSGDETLVVVSYNPLGWTREEFVQIPVSNDNIEVSDSKGQSIPSQIMPISHITSKLRNTYVKLYTGTSPSNSKYTLLFKVSVPAFGFSSYFVKATTSNGTNHSEKSIVKRYKSLHDIELKFDRASGGTTVKQILSSGITGSYCWYNASDGNSEESIQPSGAYVFRPNTSTCFPIPAPNEQAQITVFDGPLQQEILQELSPWVSQVIRIRKDVEDIEIEYTVGPIPVDDSNGKEVVLKLDTNLSSNGEFYTDSNGRDFLKRVRNYRSDWTLNVTEPVAGNYYPINLGLYIKDSEKEFSVLVDRALGGSSISDGQVELMLHRRLLYDDNKGVDEALNETVYDEQKFCEGLTVRGSLFVNLNSLGSGAKWRRTKGQRLFSPLELGFAVLPASSIDHLELRKFKASFMAAGYELPPNVALITLQELEDGSILLRLAHIYEDGEDVTLSTAAEVDIRNIFAHKEVEAVTELSLSGNQERKGMKRLNWQVKSDSKESMPRKRGAVVDNNEFIVQIEPMEIRTFRVVLDS